MRQPKRPEPDPVTLKAMLAAEGVHVEYTSVLGRGPGILTKTCSKPWQLGHGEWVVKLEGISGGVAVSHCVLSGGEP